MPRDPARDRADELRRRDGALQGAEKVQLGGDVDREDQHTPITEQLNVPELELLHRSARVRSGPAPAGAGRQRSRMVYRGTKPNRVATSSGNTTLPRSPTASI